MQPGRQLSAVRPPPIDFSARAAALRERGARVQRFFAAVSHPISTAGPSAGLRIMADALSCQHPDGSWGSDDTPRQKPCFTAQTITMLYRLGIRYDRTADGRPVMLGPGHTVQIATDWLESVQHEDGSWGEDAWDTAQVLLALHRCGYRIGDPCVNRGLNHLRSNVTDGWPDRKSYWFGPGFLGAAMQVFNRFGDDEFASSACNQIWEFWDDESACFRSPGETDGQHAPAAWQTACAIIGLHSFGPVPLAPERVDRAYGWLVKTQASDGSWGSGPWETASYCTLQAINALCLNGNNGNHEAAAKATEWFTSTYSLDGPLITRLMTAAAVARTRSEELVTQVSFYWVEEILDLLDQYRLLGESPGDRVATGRFALLAFVAAILVVLAGLLLR